MSVLSEIVEEKIAQLPDKQLREVLLILKEYAEIQAGTWSKVMDAKVGKKGG